MAQAPRDQNRIAALLGTSNVDGTTPIPIYANPITHRLLVDIPGSSGTVTDVSVVSANGFAGTVANSTTTPAITLSTTITGILQGNGTAISAATTTGSGSVVLATSPTLVTPVLGVAAATTINKITLTAPATGSTLTIADGKTLTASNTLTFTGTDSSSVNFGAGGTVLYSASTIPLTVGTTTIASGTNTKVLFDNSGVLGEYTISGSGNVAMTTSPVFTTPTLGVASATSINKVAITAPATSATLTIADGKTLTASNSITLAGTDGKTLTLTNGLTVTTNDGTLAFGAASKTLTVNKSLTLDGTDSTTITFPSTSATVARTDAAQTFTGTQTFAQVITTANAITASSNAATVPVTSRINNVTNNSAATLTITLTTAGAVDGQMVVVRIFDFSAAAQTLTWVNTENSAVTVPGTSNGSTTQPLTVGLQFNAATTKWRCIASA